MYNVGDKVKIINVRDNALYYKGEIGEITEVDPEDEDEPIRVVFKDNRIRWIYNGDFELIKAQEFKVGDRVELIDDEKYLGEKKGAKGVILHLTEKQGFHTALCEVNWDNSKKYHCFSVK